MASNLEPFAMVPRDLVGTVTPRALQVWCCLAQWTDIRDERNLTVSIKRIASEIGCSDTAVKRGLRELEKTGRMQRIGAPKTGRMNEYFLNFMKRSPSPEQAPGSKMTPPPVKNDPGYIKEVKYPLTKSPLSPPQVGGESEASWNTFWEKYPRQEKQQSARRAWTKLDETERESALAAVETLAECYDAATPARRKYCLQPHNWLKNKGWTSSASEVEEYFRVSGIYADAKAEANRKALEQHRKEEWAKREREMQVEREEYKQQKGLENDRE